MKRFTLFIITLTLTILQIAAQDTSIKGTITLSHQGNETDFAYNEMTKVMDAAADGDTVFLSTGYFQGDFIMTKKLAFIGSGADRDKGWNNCTCYEGKIVINLPENTILTSRLFDGIYFYDNNNNSINFKSTIDNIIFRKCRLYFNDSWNINSEVVKMIIDRCDLRIWRNSSQNLKKLVVRNCNVQNLYIYGDDPNSATFYHCNISTPNFVAGNNNYYCQLMHTFINCIIDNSVNKYLATPDNGNYSPTSPIFINCLYNKGDGRINTTAYCTMQNCYEKSSLDNTTLLSFTKEELLKNNYLGNDGTVVGMYGGKNPYTLSLWNKEITNKFHLDRDKKQIQFNIKVSDQQ